MAQVIIYTNENGNVSVCYPTGELSIEETQAKDTPTGSIIVDESALPTENEFFDAWELNGTTVTVNFEKAKAIKLARLNQKALDDAYFRQLNTLAGIPNEISDADFLAGLNAKRETINNATSIEELA